MLSFVSKMMNKIAAERDYPAQEVAHHLLQLQLVTCSRVIVQLDCRNPEDQQSSWTITRLQVTSGSWRRSSSTAGTPRTSGATSSTTKGCRRHYQTTRSISPATKRLGITSHISNS